MVSFDADPATYRHWRLDVDGRVAYAGVGRRRGRRPRARLRAEAQLLRPRRRHRAATTPSSGCASSTPRCARSSSPAARTRIFCAGANIRMLAPSLAPVEGELLQVHQRDPQRHRGRHRALRPDLARRGQRHRRRRRLRAGAGLRPDHAGRRPLLGRVAARGAAARRAARHRRPHPGDRQAARAPRPRRRASPPEPRASRGKQAVEWRLVDEVGAPSAVGRDGAPSAAELPPRAVRPADRRRGASRCRRWQRERDRATASATATSTRRRSTGPRAWSRSPSSGRRATSPTPWSACTSSARDFWPLAMTRELDDLILRPAHQRAGARHLGAPHAGRRRAASLAYDAAARRARRRTGWSTRSVLYLKRTLKRLDVTSRSARSR